MDSKENKRVGSQQSWSKGTARHCQSKEASILWSQGNKGIAWCHGMSVMQCKWQQISFSKRNIFLYTENKTRLYRTKYNWSVLLKLNRNIRRTKTATSICSTAGYPQLIVAKPRYTRRKTAVKIHSTTTTDCYKYLQHTVAKNTTKLRRRRRSTPANPVVPLRLTTGAPHRSR